MEISLDPDSDQKLLELNVIKRKLLLRVSFLKFRNGNSQRRQWSVRPLNEDRKVSGEYYRLVQRLDMDPKEHYKYFRMPKDRFQELLELVCDDIKPSGTHTHPVSAEEGLPLTLR